MFEELSKNCTKIWEKIFKEIVGKHWNYVGEKLGG